MEAKILRVHLTQWRLSRIGFGVCVLEQSLARW